jgi:hypothetical protein
MYKNTISVCIPIYKPQEDFFVKLLVFLEKNIISELVVIETVDAFGSDTCEERLLKITNSLRISLIHSTCVKETFNHGKSRNDLFNQTSCEYIIITTQDSDLTHNVNLEVLLDYFKLNKLDALCLRHYSSSPLFDRVFEEMFTELSSIDYANCSASSIGWWSHNFALYIRESIELLPFPSVSFAEDLYWAKLAREHGLRLAIFFQQGVVHLNRESLRSSYSRGKLEALGHFEGHIMSGMKTLEYPFWRIILKTFSEGIRQFTFLRLGSLCSDLNLLVTHRLQRFTFLITWNSLARNREV